ncbi:MAG: winged helix-turn-helix domain-containing protein [Bacteroidales bacterium]|nr:winged helix-turn-helix domain-containing protein [Bacteroidales bacterium]
MLTVKIGENAGLVWNALQGGALTAKALKKATKLKEADLNMALGWLARENNISFEISETDTFISLRK